MTDPRDALEATEKAFWRVYPNAGAEQFGALHEALRAVLELHAPMPWFEECMGGVHGQPECDEEEHFYVDDDVRTCEKNRVADRCRECTPEYPDDNDVLAPCPTVRAISTALAGGGSDE